LYVDNIKDYWHDEIAEDFFEIRQEAMKLLEEESELLEIARLVGVESLSDSERLIMESSKSIREDFLHQNAFHPQDTYTSLRKQYLMLRVIIHFHNQGIKALKEGVSLEDILHLEVRERISKMKFLSEDGEGSDIPDIFIEVDKLFKELITKKG